MPIPSLSPQLLINSISKTLPTCGVDMDPSRFIGAVLGRTGFLFLLVGGCISFLPALSALNVSSSMTVLSVFLVVLVVVDEEDEEDAFLTFNFLVEDTIFKSLPTFVSDSIAAILSLPSLPSLLSLPLFRSTSPIPFMPSSNPRLLFESAVFGRLYRPAGLKNLGGLSTLSTRIPFSLDALDESPQPCFQSASIEEMPPFLLCPPLIPVPILVIVSVSLPFNPI